MAQRKILTVSLSEDDFKFILALSDENDVPKSSIVSRAVDFYKRYCLKKKLVEGFKNQSAEDERDAMSDFSDYLKIVELGNL